MIASLESNEGYLMSIRGDRFDRLDKREFPVNVSRKISGREIKGLII